MPVRRVGAGQAVGRIAAESIELFPPGIPVIAPDWPINSAYLDALEQARAAGGRVVASDPSLEPSPLSRAPALANRPDRRSFRSGSPSATPACQRRPGPPARARQPRQFGVSKPTPAVSAR